MTIDTAEVRKARGATIGLGGLAIVVGLLMLGLGIAGGDGTTSALAWTVQGLLIIAAAGMQTLLGYQLGSNEKRTERNLRVLTWISGTFLVLGIVAVAIGDYSVVISMLVNLLLSSYYRRALRSLAQSAL